MKRYTIITCLLIYISISYSFAQSDSTANQQKNGAFIQFKTLSHNFGKIIFSQEATYNFEFTNTGNTPLKISNVKSSCGCTIPKWSSEEIAPQSTGEIIVKYDSKRSGEFYKGITIYSNATNGDIVLIIEGEVTQNPNKPVLGEK